MDAHDWPTHLGNGCVVGLVKSGGIAVSLIMRLGYPLRDKGS